MKNCNFIDYFENFDDSSKEFKMEHMTDLFKKIEKKNKMPDMSDLQSLNFFANPEIKTIFNQWKKTQFRMHTETEGMVKINNDQGKYKGQAKTNGTEKTPHGTGTKLFKSNAVHYAWG